MKGSLLVYYGQEEKIHDRDFWHTYYCNTYNDVRNLIDWCESKNLLIYKMEYKKRKVKNEG